MLISDPFAIARMLMPKDQVENGFGLKVPDKAGTKVPTKAGDDPTAGAVGGGPPPLPEGPGTPADIAATHAYITASPQHALPNLAPIPFLAQAMLGHTSGLAPIPWFSQKVLGLGPPGTPLTSGTTAPAAPAAAAPESNAMAPANGLMPRSVGVSALPPLGM